MVGLPAVAPPGARGGAAAERGTAAQRVAAGALVSPLITLCSTPFELIKVQLQLDALSAGGASGGTRRFSGAAAAAAVIVRERGVRALWLGAGVNFVREALFLGTYFSLYEDVSDALVRRGAPPGVAVPVAGGAPRFVAHMPHADRGLLGG